MRLWKRHHDEPATEDLRLIVGLGNPGSKYASTRHNVGFMVLNELASRSDLRFRSSKHRADIVRGVVDGVPLLLAQPNTYMNESGSAVQRLVAYFHIPLEHLFVVADDMDLPFGTIRLRPNGSSGGNRGLKSIIDTLGTDDFTRLRVGVGRPATSAVHHVLGPFPPEQASRLPDVVGAAADAVQRWTTVGTEAAMNEFNRSWA